MCTGEIGLPVDPENWTCLVYISFAQVWQIFKPSTFGNWYTNFDANQDLRMVLWTEHKDCTAKLKTWRESIKRWTHLAQPIGCPFIVRQKISNIWGSQSLVPYARGIKPQPLTLADRSCFTKGCVSRSDRWCTCRPGTDPADQLPGTRSPCRMM
jgi:hypothetical protein